MRGAVRRRGLASRSPQARKPLVEKKRRARINESLQELRLLLAGAEVRRAGAQGVPSGRAGGAALPGLTAPLLPAPPPAQVQAKLENAEVLELTVRRVQGALRGRARGEWLRGAFSHPLLPRAEDFSVRRPVLSVVRAHPGAGRAPVSPG